MDPAEGEAVGKPPEFRTLGTVAWIVACAMLAGLALLTLLQYAHDLLSPFRLAYGEGIALDRVRALLRHEPLYPAIGGAPYITWNFPPLYAWLCAAVSSVAGPSFAAGRTVSVVAALVATCCVYRLAAVGQARGRWPAVGALLFLTQAHVALAGDMMTVDVTGLAFALCGLAAVQRGCRPAWAGLLFAFGLLCKQSLFAAPLAAVLSLLAARRRREAVELVGAALAAGMALLALTGASPATLWYHLVMVNSNDWIAEHALRMLQVGAPSLVPTAILAGIGLWQTRALPGTGLPRWYLLASCLTALLIGKIGSGFNYILDLSAALAILAAHGMPQLRCLSRRGLPVGAADALVAVILLCHVALAQVKREVIAPRAELEAVNRIIAEAPGPVIADEPGLVSGAGQPLWLQPFEFTQLALARRWDPRPVEDALQRGGVALVVLCADPRDERRRDPEGTWLDGRFTPAMMRALQDDFRLDHRCGRFFILRPRRGPYGEG